MGSGEPLTVNRWSWTPLRTLLCCIALAALVAAERGVFADQVILKDGRELSGRLEREGDRMWVVLDSGGVQLVRKESVDRVEKEVTEVTLRDGRVGRLLARVGDEIAVRFASGDVERVSQEQVEDTAKKVVVETLARPEAEQAEKTRKIKLPSLRTAVGELLAEFLPPVPEPGLVARVAGEKAYVTLGQEHGLLTGDRLEIVRGIEEVRDPASGEIISEERDVVGSLKVLSVQPRLSICELVDGKAEQKGPSGELNQVVQPQEAPSRKVLIAHEAKSSREEEQTTTLLEVGREGWQSFVGIEAIDAVRSPERATRSQPTGGPPSGQRGRRRAPQPRRGPARGPSGPPAALPSPVRRMPQQAEPERPAGDVVVTRVAPGSPAQRAGVKVGDLLLRWNDTPIEDAESLEELVDDSSPGAQVQLTVRRRSVRSAGVTEESLADALAQACRSHSRLQVATEAEAEYELTAEAVPAENGSLLKLSLTDCQSGQPVAEGETLYRTKVSLAELGFKSAISATLPAPPHFGAAPQALRQRIGSAYDLDLPGAERCIYVSESGSGERGIWVFSSGEVVVACRQSLSNASVLFEMETAWKAAAEALAVLTASIDTQDIARHYRRSVSVFTERARQHQLLLASDDIDDGVLDWPRAGVRWAGIQAWGYGWGINLAGREYRDRESWHRIDLSGLGFGSYAFSADDNRSGSWLRLDAFLPNADGRISLHDPAGNPLTDREVLSAEIDSLYVPVCDAYVEFR